MAARPDPRTLVAPPAVRVGPVAPPPPAAVRMDVAAFVGRVRPPVPPGPPPPPAAVESAEEFAATFPEAADSRLGPAVRAFFRNGGRRCWVVPAEPPFLDERLALTGTGALVREAALFDDAPKGVHAVLALEEVTLLAVPDAFPPRPVPVGVRSGTVKSIDAGKRTITIAVGGGDETYLVTADTETLAGGRVVPDPFADPRLAAGARVAFGSALAGGKRILVRLWLDVRRGVVKAVAAGVHTVTITVNAKDQTFLLTAETETLAGGRVVPDPFADPRFVPGVPVAFLDALRGGQAVLVGLWLGAATPGAPTGTGAAFSRYMVPDPAVLALAFTLALQKLAGAKPTDPPVREWLELSWQWASSSSDAEAAKAEDAARGGARFVLVRSVSPAFPPDETETVYCGPATRVLAGTKPDVYRVSVGTEPAFYRVRAETAALTGAWENPVEQAIPTGDVVKTVEDPVATQIAAVQVCAARGDALAILVPPEVWPDGATTWVTDLTVDPRWNAADKLALQTHAAFWGPWVLARDGERADAEPDAYPADGAVCGLLARRAAERGAWASIMNLPVAGALGLGPPPYGPGDLVPLYAAEAAGAVRAASDSREAVTGQQAQGVNVLARTSRGFVAVGERTPPPDPRRDAGFPSDVVPVRRLMALLRRELARVGVGLAFLPNGPALERRAVRAVEAVLESLLRRGALVGPDARSSFQVTARAGAGAADEGRLEVEVRVRPALPLRLLTLQLVRTGEGAFTLAEGQG